MKTAQEQINFGNGGWSTDGVVVVVVVVWWRREEFLRSKRLEVKGRKAWNAQAR